MRYLKQSTAVEVLIGPFLDKTDGFTAKTALTIPGAINCDLYKGVAKTDITLTASLGSNDLVHVADGYYRLELTTSNTDTCGSLRVTMRDDAVFLPLWEEFHVLPANVYDAWTDNTLRQSVDAAAISGDATAADNLETMLDGTGGQTLSLKQLNVSNSAGDAIVATSSGGNGVGLKVTGNGTGQGLLATGGTTGAGLRAAGGSSSGSGLEAAGGAPNGSGFVATKQGTGLKISADLTGDVTGTIAGIFSGDLNGNVTGEVGGVGTNGLNAAALAADAVEEIRAAVAASTIAAVSVVQDKTGYALSASGLDSISTTAPTGVAGNFREMLIQIWRRFFKKSTLTATQLTTYRDDGTTVATTQTVSDDGTTQTQGAAS